MRVFEFFSGIGGMRLALPSEVQVEKHVAYEVSPVVNQAYRHNFPDDRVVEKLVEHVKETDLDGQSDLWLLSPPCQPYTATIHAKQKQSADRRAQGFHYLIQVHLIHTNPPPDSIFIYFV